ncbi:hypothetical protein ACHAPT_011390 [Fusarium lateritium]
MSSATRALRIKDRASRSISIAVTPSPVTFAERRSILKLLEQHGPVEFFKVIPGKDASFVSLMRDAAAVTRVTADSPHKVTVKTPNKSTTPATERRKASVGGFGTLLNAIESPYSFEQDKPEEAEKEFTVEVSPSPDYRHHLSARPILNRPWPAFINKQKSFIAETLDQSLPDSLATTGLKHWDPDFGEQPSQNNKASDRLALRNWIPSKFRPFDGPKEQLAENDAPEDAELEDIEQPAEKEWPTSLLRKTRQHQTNLSSSTGA